MTDTTDTRPSLLQAARAAIPGLTEIEAGLDAVERQLREAGRGTRGRKRRGGDGAARHRSWRPGA